MPKNPEKLTWIRSFVDDFNRHDVPILLSAAVPSFILRRGDGSSFKNGDGLKSLLEEFFVAVPDAKLTTNNAVAFDGPTALVEWQITGTHSGPWQNIAATGRAISFVGADLVTFDISGKITHQESRVATAEFLAQIGIDTPSPMNKDQVRVFAKAMTKAWCDHDAAGVASLFAAKATRVINAGIPAVGRAGIEENTQSFITAVPDLELLMEDLFVQDDLAVYSWTLRGTHSETGNRINISGFEIWQLGADGLIVDSRGYYDSAAYNHQIAHGASAPDS
ncbi:ester cyclase [Sneathiella marina]|uniref:Ester cyclase n=1 Tax=Sneathiella marina TaxID=2950108 RepID=A0ABY4WAV3_9PROT|nr:nuclear transport factor 2 family protein [Sneathiella marina]USG62890.1 ester cyclase [Sneathiella marina]